MMRKIKKPELLCPAKDFEVLKTAVDFGADAVYIGGEAFSLRAKARNFSPADMAEGIEYAHARGAKVHVTANILAHNRDMDEAAQYFRELSRLHPDAILVADPGMFMLARQYCPDIDIHISTQANNTNYRTFLFWHELGAKRVVCARELSLDEIRQIREAVPEDLEVEAFVHGAMCISYSGRCLLSSFLAGRDANHGECTHPCRWKYTLLEKGGDQAGRPASEEEAEMFAVEEQTRPGEYMPVFENERGTYLFNSRDLCMIEHIPELVQAGIDSLKIEGRMKTALYVATVARTYRKAIDDYFEGEEVYRAHMEWYRSQIRECTYRRFTTGFYFGRPSDESMVYDSNTYINEAVWLGIVEDAQASVSGDTKAWKVTITQRNKFRVGDNIEIMKPDGENVRTRVLDMINMDNEHVPDAPHPQEKLFVILDRQADTGDILRMKTTG